ncbi:uncharacterized protein BX664DRAFT_367193 [Halteromyces radiatus]|uniref:uncharacterized protein n=1 Tax=Halteromyces radiatus TaxID=101107 RepID=UPI0022210983|nr:uncharacterized protein BX664DRAFT_367193 [Halteromyces radiatus]KAI8078788.1 hypothetical protein BX664DRAFT_367193 [Halteromyces radiatus]
MQRHWLYLHKKSAYHSSNSRQLQDPPPLDITLAKHVLNVMLRFMFYSSDPSKERTTFFTHFPHLQSDADFMQGNYSNYCLFMSRLNNDDTLHNIYDKSCRVIYYISASNWALIFSKIKSYILHLSTTSEETPDTLILRLLEYSSLNARRLSMVLAELQLSFLHFKKNTQLNLAVSLRRGIWNWIEAYPTEFEDYQLSHRRLEGSPEILFDMCNSLADTTRKKTYFWPLQTMLMILCPEILMTLTMELSSSNLSKKGQFLIALQKTIKGDRMPEVSVICYTDICLLAGRLARDSGAALWNLVPDVMDDLQNWILDPLRPFSHGSDMLNAGIVLDRLILVRDADYSLIRLSHQFMLKSTHVYYSGSDCPLMLKASKLKVGALMESENPPFVQIPVDIHGAIGNRTRHLFFWLTSLHKERLSKPNSKRNTASGSSNNNNNSNNLAAITIKPKPTKSYSFSGNSTKKANINPFDNEGVDIDDMIFDVLTIINARSEHLFYEPSHAGNSEEIARVITTTASYLNDPSQKLADIASSCLYSLHQSETIMMWADTSNFLIAYWQVSSQVLRVLAQTMLHHHPGRGLSLKSLLNLLKQLLTARISFLNTYQNVAPTEEFMRMWIQTSIDLEMALLVLLCSMDDFIYARVTECIGILCEEYQLIEAITDPRLLVCTMYENLGAYLEFTGQADTVPGGRKLHQRRLWRILRQMTRCTPGNVKAWEEVWKRCKVMTARIICFETNKETTNRNINMDGKRGSYNEFGRVSNNTTMMTMLYSDTSGSTASSGAGTNISSSTPSDTSLVRLEDDPVVEWEYYAGFLSSLGQVCLAPVDNEIQAAASSPSTSGKQQQQTSSHTTCLHPQQQSSATDSPTTHHSDQLQKDDIFFSTEAKTAMVEEFVGMMMDLLVCDSLMIRERVRELIGNSTSPALYWTISRQFRERLDQCFDHDKPICEPRRILFVEQIITVFRFVLTGAECAEAILSMDFSKPMIQLCTFISALEDNDTSKRIKIKMCQFCESLLSRKNQLSFQKDVVVRSHLLKCIRQWTSDFNIQSDTQQYSSSSSKPLTLEDNIQVDLDMACLRTMVVLLYQLPLQPTEPTEEVDLIQRKSKMFYKYFTFFLKLLARCKASEVNIYDIRNEAISMKRTNISTFKHNIILCLSNLLSANVDVGLKYSLSMGYHEDIQTRSAFMQVLTNILKQGTKFETLGESVISDRYHKLVSLLFKFDYAVPKSLCQVCSASETDDVATSLLSSFASVKKSLVLLQMVTEIEVENTINETDLFRKTSIATKCLTSFAKANGSRYINQVLKPVMDQLVSRPKLEQNFELDPSNTGREFALRNKDNVTSATNLILDAICNSADLAPPSFRSVCKMILEAVQPRFPESKYTAVGSFIFLRFFCPIIVSPESAGILAPGVITRDLRRGLLIIAKVIQNIANNILFGSKEVYMVILNDFVTENMYRVTSYLRTMSSVVDNDNNNNNNNNNASENDVGISPPMSDTDYRLLHSVLAKNFEDIQRDLAAKKILMFQNQESMAAWKDYMEDFSKVLVQLGPPSDTKRSNTRFNLQQRQVYSSEDQQYSAFMRKHSNTNTNMIASTNICYLGGRSISGHNIIYFIFRRLNVNEMDMELVMHYIFQMLENMGAESFIVVMDVTRFGSENEIPKQRFIQFCEMFPKSTLANLQMIICYNSNTCFRRYLKRADYQTTNKIIKRIVFAVSLEEIAEYIHPTALQLPKSTVALDKEPSNTFYTVSRVWQYNVPTPVTIKVSSEFVQVISNRKQEIIFNTYAFTNDVYHISEIQNIRNPGIRGDQVNELAFTSTVDKMTIYIRSPKADQLLHTILNSKRRYEAIRPSTLATRIIRPNDVPGRLLNMALLNLGSNDSQLRLTAYNLLYTLCRTFNFNVGTNLMDAKELCLPPNCSRFVATISGRLASTEKQLTLEFLNECFIGFDKSTDEQRYLCLHYMTPWIPNLGATAHGTPEDISRTKEVLRMLIGITLTQSMHVLIQTKLWKTLGKVDGVRDMAIDASLQISREHGLGSKEAEAMADTCVTLSNILVRSKLVAITLRLLQQTTEKPTQSLINHPLWTEIAIMTRFNLMLSFDNFGPLKNYIPDMLHMITLLVGVGPTLIRTTIHGISINLIQSLCILPTLPEDSRQELQHLMGKMGEKRMQLLFGLVKPHANAFTISQETLSDPLTEPFDLMALETIINTFLRIVELGAPTIDISNAWRARWMGHVTTVVFQENPAIQPRAFVALGCLGRHQVDDDLLFQILCTLRRALDPFDPNDSCLLKSMVMCLRNVVENLSSDSRYLVPLFWVTLSILSINHPDVFCMATELLQGVLQVMNTNHLFDVGEVAMKETLLDARRPVATICAQLDQANGVKFDTHFSFAVVGLLMKGWRTSPQAKEAAYQCLLSFLNCSTRYAKNSVDHRVLGYVASLISVARKTQSRQDILRFAGVHYDAYCSNRDSFFKSYHDDDVDNVDDDNGENMMITLFDKLDIPDNDTALLFISCLAAQLKSVESESDRLFLYELLSEAADTMPDVFSIVYPSLLPAMNNLIRSTSTSVPLLNAIQSILMAAYADDRFQYPKHTLHDRLCDLGFSAFEDPFRPLAPSSMIQVASLVGQLVDWLIQ